MSEHSQRPSSPSSPKQKHHEHHHHHHAHHEKDSENLVVAWFPSPMDGYDEEAEGFSPRHEASTIELFFDLWFVANLATFTQYHAITNRYNFWSYVAFFFVLWSSWFHIVCYDARFASDSVWERACKVVHFCSFATFALVGYKFAPLAQSTQDETPHWIYRTLCFAILLSRAWLALQYILTTIMCSTRKHRRHKLTLPLALNAVLFAVVAVLFGGMFGAFYRFDANITGILIAVYVVLTVEFFGTLAISIAWRRLSFRATHIGERLGLLGLIIIGEGVIGTTKTIVRTMGKNGPAIDPSAQVFCIVLILLFMWILYFDRVPKYHFGVVKQQIWMALHFPFHLAILGVVEGAQQLAQARYIHYTGEMLIKKAQYGCVSQNLDGQALVDDLTKNIEYFKLNESAQGTLALEFVWKEIYLLGNETGVCSPANVSDVATTGIAGLPWSFAQFFTRSIGAMFQSFDVDIPPEGEVMSFAVAYSSWAVVYIYFWSALILLLVCYTITALLAEVDGRGDWRSLRRYVSLTIISRTLMIALAITLLVLGVADAPNYYFINYYLSSSWILPTVVLALWVVCTCDRLDYMRRMKGNKPARYASLADVDGDTQGLVMQDMGGLRRRGTNAYGYPSH